MAKPGKKTPPKKAGAKKKETMVYVGPNMSGKLLLTQFSTFRNGLPKHIEEAVKTDAALKRLIVPVSDLSMARQQIKKAGTGLAKAFIAMSKTLTAKREG